MLVTSDGHCARCASKQVKCVKHNIWAVSWQKPTKWLCAPRSSDQPGHPPSLIRVAAVRMKKTCVLSYPLSAQRRLWSDCAYAQADLNPHWAYTHFVGFVMSRLISCFFDAENTKPILRDCTILTDLRASSRNQPYLTTEIISVSKTHRMLTILIVSLNI